MSLDDIKEDIRKYLSKFEYSSDHSEEFINDMAENYERLSDVSDKQERLKRATEYYRICRLESGSVLDVSKVIPDTK